MYGEVSGCHNWRRGVAGTHCEARRLLTPHHAQGSHPHTDSHGAEGEK